MGEGFGPWAPGVDADVMPLVTSANIACGYHAGDPGVMRATVELALRHGTAVGAHPGYPDLQGFGRRAMDLSPAEVEDAVLLQIGALHAFTRALGVPLVHVKPHGALYNRAAKDAAIAAAIARAVAGFDAGLILVGLAGSELVTAGQSLGLPVAREAFADRAYEPDGTLRARGLPGAMLPDSAAMVEQAIMIARDGQVTAYGGTHLSIDADTICLHGDTREAAGRAQALRAGLRGAGIAIRPLREVLAQRVGGTRQP